MRTHGATRAKASIAAALALLGLLVPIGPEASAAPPRPTTRSDPGLADRLQVELETARAAWNSPGMTACILFPDDSVWTGASGLADIASGRPVEPDTPFGIASVSKTFLAAAIMAQVGQGAVHLGDSVARLLPGVVVGGEPLDPRITVRQLLDHTSGLPDFLIEPVLGRDALAAPDVAWDAARALAYATDPRDPPGTVYRYANTNYVLLGLLLERLTGRSVAEELRARFFDPLGLDSVFVQDVEAPTGELPTAYRMSRIGPDAVASAWASGTPVRPYRAIVTAAGPAGDIAADACDVARWLRALFSGAAIEADLVRRMVDDARRITALDPDLPYGLGVQARIVEGHPALGHSGRLGHRAAARWFPDLGLAMVVLMNDSRNDPADVLARLLRHLAPFRGHLGPEPV